MDKNAKFAVGFFVQWNMAFSIHGKQHVGDVPQFQYIASIFVHNVSWILLQNKDEMQINTVCVTAPSIGEFWHYIFYLLNKCEAHHLNYL